MILTPNVLELSDTLQGGRAYGELVTEVAMAQIRSALDMHPTKCGIAANASSPCSL